MSDSLLQPEDRVLSTLNADGKRRWIDPRLSPGRFWNARRIVAYVLIAVFASIPYIPINGKPAMLLDVVRREFTFFGRTFLPTDTLLLALLVVGIFLTVFLVTAVSGRIWCGWGCPQTVYLEFVFRPIERFLEGGAGAKAHKPAAWRKLLKFVVFAAISFFLAHTFLAYFVGVENLRHWIFGSPAAHPVAFLIVAITTAMMLFDFGFFREQMCIVACPYGRFQSVMLDRDSLIVGYDKARGEPRSRLKRDVALQVLDQKQGDCIDCHMCVTTCPTGIDIREGLQMECIHCTQCIDACDRIMDKIGKPRGLVRYGSQNSFEGAGKRFIRPRVIVYAAILTLLASAFVFLLVTAKPADILLLRGGGMPFNMMADGRISNQLKLKITNRTDKPADYAIEVVSPAGVVLEIPQNPMRIDGGKMRTEGILVDAPRGIFKAGSCDLTIRVSEGGREIRTLSYRLLGPESRPEAHHEEQREDGHSTEEHDK
jgi:cytochrome c oxidase accessory protein FixG